MIQSADYRNIAVCVLIFQRVCTLRKIAGQNDVVYSVRLRAGRLRQYYADYKDYAYLPDEDYAVPKSISRFLGKDVKRPATRDTCYTWFPCTEDFLKDPQKLTTYLKSALRYSLS